MKKKLLMILLLATMAFGLSGCADGQQLRAEENTAWQRMLSIVSRNILVYSFRDEETGVWYIATNNGVTPRLNADGSLYVTGGKSEK